MPNPDDELVEVQFQETVLTVTEDGATAEVVTINVPRSKSEYYPETEKDDNN